MTSTGLSEDAISIRARCHCGANDLALHLPPGAIPLKSVFCHCDDCRSCTGQLFSTFIYPKRGPTPTASWDKSELTRYSPVHEPGMGIWFCSTCGANFVVTFPMPGNLLWRGWAPGLWDRTQGLLKRGHHFIGGTIDGGAAIWMAKEVGGIEAPRWLGNERNKSGVLSNDELEGRMRNTLSPAWLSDRLGAKRDCGSVSFYITRPDKDTLPSFCAFADVGKPRWRACICMCTSCRLTSGSEMTFWAGISPVNFFNKDGSPVTGKTPGLTIYKSSPKVTRGFCATCGAKIFYRNEEQDPPQIDVAVGLFEDVTARIEGWFKWDKHIHFSEDAIDKDLVQSIDLT